MLLILIRHGETVDNVAGLYAGVTDSKLTNQGVLQASRLAAALHARFGPLTHVFASDLQRAARTAQAVVDFQNEKRHGSNIDGDATAATAAVTAEPSVATAIPDLGNDDRHSLTYDFANPPPSLPALDPIILPILREQDFGAMERRSWSSGSGAKPGPDGRSPSRADLDAKPAETKAAMDVRANGFIDDFVMPLLAADAAAADDEGTGGNGTETEGGGRAATAAEEQHLRVVVVSHGILLSRLWKCLLARCRDQRRDLVLAPEVEIGARGVEHLGAWSNTGYLVLEVKMATATTTEVAQRDRQPGEEEGRSAKGIVVDDGQSEGKGEEGRVGRVSALVSGDGVGAATEPPPLTTPSSSPPLRITVNAVNVTDHLRGLKRTRGGVGSAAHDDKQRSIHGFFKKKKARVD